MKVLFQLMGLFLLLCGSAFSQNQMNWEHKFPLFNQVDPLPDQQLMLHEFKPSASKSFGFFRPLRIETDTTLYLYTYDNNGEVLVQIIQYKTDDNWVNKTRYTYTYDNANLASLLEESWLNDSWMNYGRGNYTYDNVGNLITYFYEGWTNGAWVNDFRINYNYDINGNPLSELFDNWYLGTWVSVLRYTYSYDNGGNLTMSLFETWTGNWENTKKITYTYNNNFLAETLDQNWSSGSNSWINFLRWSYGYSNGNTVAVTMEEWYTSWNNRERYLYTYSPEGRMLTKTAEDWLGGTWENDYKITYTYDPEGNLTTLLDEDWWQGTWWDINKADYVYDSDNNCTRCDHYSWYQMWVSSIGNITIYYNNGNEHLNFTCKWVKLEYDIFTGVNDFPGSEITYSLGNNYPNPFNPATKITYSIPEYAGVVIKVFDIIGNKIETLVDEEKPAGRYEITWNAADLPSGIYFYQISAGSFVETKKMTLMK